MVIHYLFKFPNKSILFSCFIRSFKVRDTSHIKKSTKPMLKESIKKQHKYPGKYVGKHNNKNIQHLYCM